MVSLTEVVGADLQRYFLPADVSQRLVARITATKATALVGGNTALASMRADIASATGPNDFIYMLNWHCNVDLELVPGDATSTLRSMLTTASAAGVQIRGMFWAGTVPPHPPLVLDHPRLIVAGEIIRSIIIASVPNHVMNTKAVQLLEGFGGDTAAILDTGHLAFGSHHQKVLVLSIGGKLIAYVGGVEFNADRLFSLPSEPGSPLFDISVRLEDASAWLVLDTFIGRWEAHPNKHGSPLRGGSLPIPLPSGGPLAIQMTHTYGKGFPYPAAVQSASTALANGIKNARQFFYMEDQYFVGSPKMDAAFRDALSSNTNLIGIIVIAAEDSVSDLPDLPFRRRAFLGPLAATFPGRFLVFERLGAGSTTGPTAYVHSKLLIVDDEAAFIGSVNSSRRSWFHDSEVDATIVDTTGPGSVLPGARGWVRDFRCTIWSRHFNRPAASLGNPVTDLTVWQGITSGTVVGTSVRPYNVSANVPRFEFKGKPVPAAFLDKLWETIEDPT